MLRQRTRTLQAAIATADALATVAAFFTAYYLAGPMLEQVPSMKVVLPVSRYLWALWVSVPMWWALFVLFNCYDLSPMERMPDSLRRLWRPLLIGVLAIGTLTFFQKEPDFSRRVVAAICLTNVAFIVVGRLIVLGVAARGLRKEGGLRRILIVGRGRGAEEFRQTVEKAGWGLETVGLIAPTATAESGSEHIGTLDDLPRLLDEQSIDDVVISEAEDLATVQRVIHVCEEVGVAIHIPSRFFQPALSRPHLEPFFGIPMLTFSTTPYSPIALGIKRAADLIGGTVLLVLTLPLMALIAAGIKLTSPGPVFFAQRRAGLYGRPFMMIKFRSMIVGAEARLSELSRQNEADGPAFKMRDDPRVTPLGRRLRRYSLDELPQLWNVIRGDMSLIGPRPPLPKEVASYDRWQRRRLSMRPGLTCIWQVSDRRHSSFEKWMADDLAYIDNWSLWLDLKIALKTLPAVIRGTGV